MFMPLLFLKLPQILYYQLSEKKIQLSMKFSVLCDLLFSSSSGLPHNLMCIFFKQNWVIYTFNVCFRISTSTLSPMPFFHGIRRWHSMTSTHFSDAPPNLSDHMWQFCFWPSNAQCYYCLMLLLPFPIFCGLLTEPLMVAEN